MPATTPARSYTLADFDFELPAELIAQHPAPERSASRLLDATGPHPVDRGFRELPALLEAGDLLVFNDTRVIKARLLGAKASGGAVEALIERLLPGHEVLAHLRASKSPRPGSTVRFVSADAASHFDAEVLGRGGPDDSLFHLRFPADPLVLLERHGHGRAPRSRGDDGVAQTQADPLVDEGRAERRLHDLGAGGGLVHGRHHGRSWAKIPAWRRAPCT